MVVIVNNHEIRISQNEINIQQNTTDIIQNASDIAQNAANISQNVLDIAQNAFDIAGNAGDILSLEYRALGSTRPAAYDELVGYLAGDYVVNPATDPQSYYRAIDDIALPAGVFNPALWHRVSLNDNDAYIELTREQSIAAFVAAGYGGIGVNVVEPIGTIDATFQTLEGFDTDLISVPLDVTYDKANHGLMLDRQGIWEFTIKVTLTFDDLNAGRQIQFRAFNSTDATPGANTFTYFVGRNQGGVNITLTIEVEILPSEVGDLIQLQVASSTDTFLNSSNIGTYYQVKHISERKEDL